MHETISTTSSTLLPWVINSAKGNDLYLLSNFLGDADVVSTGKGLKMVTVAECLGTPDGAYVTNVTKTGATTC
jgi:hypothetical protein